jgi:16S rRNA (guanine527-N7)-methyltransferase
VSAPPGSNSSGELPDALFVAADELFGDRLALAEQYGEILATDAVVRGLIGPRETHRIWDRHILNCAAMHSAVPYESYVADVGSGAGLPGIPLALARPDLRIALIEPLLRRVTFLDEVVDRLGLRDRVEVLRGRAEEMISMFHVKPADVVTARAVAPLDRLAGWTLPLVRVGGSLLAMKGSTAAEEIVEHRKSIHALGGGDPSIVVCGEGLLAEPTTVVKVVRESERLGGQASDMGPSERPTARDAKGSRAQGRQR